MKFLPWILVIVASALNAFGSFFLKKSQLYLENAFLGFINKYFILGLFFYGINVILFTYALRFLAVSKAYPFLAGLSFLMVISLGVFFLRENITFLNFLGAIFVLAGIFLLAR